MDRILVIDDMPSNVEILVSSLRSAGYDVITATDGALGIKKAQLFMPDLIVLDLIMPKMSGYDVCRTLKRDPETTDIIILAVTAMASKDTRMRVFEAGADEYMEKTFDKGLFLAKVKSLLRVKVLRDELRENYRVLEEQNKLFELQLEMAKHVQQALVSDISFSDNGVSFAGRYMPAQSVGGDMYDVMMLSPNLVAVFIADVSGHGISAALLTSMLKIMFRNMVSEDIEPHELFRRMNEDFCGIFDGSSVTIYACAFFAVIDINRKEVRYSSSGNISILYFDHARGAVTELDVGGRPLGLMSESVYTTTRIPCGPGDIFLFQTDGLCDSLYKSEPELFTKKLSELLLDSHDLSPDEIIDEALNEFYNAGEDVRAEKTDDVSVIICKME